MSDRTITVGPDHGLCIGDGLTMSGVFSTSPWVWYGPAWMRLWHWLTGRDLDQRFAVLTVIAIDGDQVVVR